MFDVSFINYSFFVVLENQKIYLEPCKTSASAATTKGADSSKLKFSKKKNHDVLNGILLSKQ